MTWLIHSLWVSLLWPKIIKHLAIKLFELFELVAWNNIAALHPALIDADI